jgi:tRNA dimethylallyltransferase
VDSTLWPRRSRIDAFSIASRISIGSKTYYLNPVSKPEIILIAGPTASGKSALALALAEKLGGVIINADSMQVYRDLRIITARPTPAEERRAPHLLYGHVDAAENFSVGRWCTEAAAALAAATRDAHPAIIAGGTGLYFNALTRGLADVPPIPPEIRKMVRARLLSDGVAALHSELKARDPAAAARLMPGDRARITRALEVALATGRSLLAWHEESKPASLDPSRAAKIFLMPDRDELLSRIDARFDAMIAAGAIEEVRALAARSLDPDLPAMKAHGVPWLISHLRGETSLADAVEGAKRDTRQYTKRQATWFRNQLPDFAWVEPQQALAAIEAQLRSLSR